MKTNIFFTSSAASIFFLFVFIGGIVALCRDTSCERVFGSMALLTERQLASPAVAVSSPFRYPFSVAGTLHEAGEMNESSSPYWWLNSGAKFILANGTGKTNFGELPEHDKWRLLYAKANPVDTDNGYHPQNIFRILTRSKWKNFRQEIYFRIDNTNISTSSNRNASNGILLFGRYQDSNTLYYAGIRVDGYAAIKKKKNGAYYTLAYQPLPDTSLSYNRDTNPNLLPIRKWIGLRSEIKTNPDNTVRIKLFMDKDKTGNWVLIAEATDDNKSFGGDVLLSGGFGGIRTDFMDVEFDDYRAEEKIF